jgi:hypothetical protein
LTYLICLLEYEYLLVILNEFIKLEKGKFEFPVFNFFFFFFSFLETTMGQLSPLGKGGFL